MRSRCEMRPRERHRAALRALRHGALGVKRDGFPVELKRAAGCAARQPRFSPSPAARDVAAKPETCALAPRTPTAPALAASKAKRTPTTRGSRAPRILRSEDVRGWKIVNVFGRLGYRNFRRRRRARSSKAAPVVRGRLPGRASPPELPRCARRRASDPEGRSRSGGLRSPGPAASPSAPGPDLAASVNSIWLASAARRREPGTRSSGEHSAKCSRSSRSHCADPRVRFADLDDDEVRVQRCDDALDCSAVGQREHRAIAGMHFDREPIVAKAVVTRW